MSRGKSAEERPDAAGPDFENGRISYDRHGLIRLEFGQALEQGPDAGQVAGDALLEGNAFRPEGHEEAAEFRRALVVWVFPFHDKRFRGLSLQAAVRGVGGFQKDGFDPGRIAPTRDGDNPRSFGGDASRRNSKPSACRSIWAMAARSAAFS